MKCRASRFREPSTWAKEIGKRFMLFLLFSYLFVYFVSDTLIICFSCQLWSPKLLIITLKSTYVHIRTMSIPYTSLLNREKCFFVGKYIIPVCSKHMFFLPLWTSKWGSLNEHLKDKFGTVTRKLPEISSKIVIPGTMKDNIILCKCVIRMHFNITVDNKPVLETYTDVG